MNVQLPYPLRWFQAAALAALLRFSVLVWHRRGGKTVFAVKRLVTAALNTQRPNARYAYIAPFYRQAKAVAWDYLKEMLREVPGVVFNESELSAALGNGAIIRLFGADNPDSLRGLYFDGVVLDEVADMRPEVWGGIIRPALTDRQGWALFIGTPKGTNLFSEIYYKALNDPEWYAEIRRASDTGVIPEEELAKAKASMSRAQYAQEFDCDFGASGDDILCPMEMVRAAQARTVRPEQIAGSPVILGVDVARYKDRSVILRRQGICAFQPLVFKDELSLMALAAYIAKEMETHKPDAVFIDEGGVGIGAVDRLVQMGYDVAGVNFGATSLEPTVYENMRIEMWDRMSEWLKTGALPQGEEWIADLTGPRYDYRNRRGVKSLESKEEMRARGVKSPDLGDALALTFAAPVANKISPYEFAGLRGTGGGKLRSEDDDTRRAWE